MQFRHKLVTLNGTAQNLVVREPADSRNTMSIQNTMSKGFAYLGGPGVTSSNYGHKLYPGQSFVVEMASSDDLWAAGDNGVVIAVFVLDRG